MNFQSTVTHSHQPDALLQQNCNIYLKMHLQHPTLLPLPSQEPRSVSQLKIFKAISLSEINRSQYLLSPHLLIESKITELMRAKLRQWMYEQTSFRRISRRICCLTLTILDLFFMKGGQICLQQFHALSLACLLLANKFEDNSFIQIDHSVFPAQQLIQLQAKICYKLNFMLRPITYVQIMDEFLYLWNIFAKNYSDLWLYSGVQTIHCQRNNSILLIGCRYFYQLLDSIYMVLTVFNFNIRDIVWEVLKICLSKDHQYVLSCPVSIQNQVVISFWSNPSEISMVGKSFSQIYQKFIQNLKDKGVQQPLRNQNLQNFVQSFIQQQFAVSQDTMQNQFNTQTLSKHCYTLAKRIMKKNINNQRKSSSETTI